MTGLFQVQWRGAGEGLTPPGEWRTTERFRTLAEAQESIRARPVDWAHGRVFVDHAEAAELVGELVCALLASEWEGRTGPAGDVRGECAACEWTRSEGHQRRCIVDAALTKAGLATQAERDAAREALGLR